MALTTLFDGAKKNLLPTEHPNALPASWRVPGSPFRIVPGASAGEEIETRLR
jgi:hypothetical protein